MDKTKCNKYGCEGLRFRGRLCEDHFLRWKAHQRAFSKSLNKVMPPIYTDRSKTTIR